MRRPLQLLLISALLGAGLLAGCGGDDEPKQDDGPPQAVLKKEYDRAYRPVNDDILALGEEVGETVSGAADRSEYELYETFNALANRTSDVRGRLDALRPPDEYEDLDRRLSVALQAVGSDLRQIAQAADTGDAKNARKQSIALARHSPAVDRARRALARQTGAQVEDYFGG